MDEKSSRHRAKVCRGKYIQMVPKFNTKDILFYFVFLLDTARLVRSVQALIHCQIGIIGGEKRLLMELTLDGAELGLSAKLILVVKAR